MEKGGVTKRESEDKDEVLRRVESLGLSFLFPLLGFSRVREKRRCEYGEERERGRQTEKNGYDLSLA